MYETLTIGNPNVAALQYIWLKHDFRDVRATYHKCRAIQAHNQERVCQTGTGMCWNRTALHPFEVLFVHRSVLMTRGAAEGLYDYVHMKEEMAALSAASPVVPAPQAGVETAPPPTPLEKWLGSRRALNF